MSARYYIYRNLRTARECSVKQRGIVIDMIKHAILEDVHFVVSEAGRYRAVINKQRNVHAYVSPVTYKKLSDRKFREQGFDVTKMREITYNPFYLTGFVYKDTKEPVDSLPRVLVSEGRVFSF